MIDEYMPYGVAASIAHLWALASENSETEAPANTPLIHSSALQCRASAAATVEVPLLELLKIMGKTMGIDSKHEGLFPTL